MKARILLNFNKYRDSDFETKCNSIHSSMQGNTSFPNPTPSLKTLQQSINSFSTALIASKTRDKLKVLLKNDTRKALTQVLRSLANYVTMVANGDRAMMVSTGYDVSTETSSPKQLGAIENFSVRPGENSGEVIVTLNKTANAQRYACFFALAPVENDAWQHVFKRTPSFVIKGLASLKSHSFRVAALGPNDQVVYSEIITKVVL